MRFRREAEFLLCCVAPVSPKRLDRLRAMIEDGIKWEVVMRAAPRQGVMQNVYRALVPELASLLPPNIHDRMRREFQGNAVRNCHLAAAAVGLCRLLEKHGVHALVLKGPALAAYAYGDLTLRQSTDLDLLVHQRDLDRAFVALGEFGFHAKAPLTKTYGRGSSWQVTLMREGGLFELDLHWRLSPPYFPFTPEGDQLWARAVEMDIGAGKVKTLCPEDLILFLCAHGAKHGWQTLSGVSDVAYAVSVNRYDWDRLAADSRALGSEQIVLLGLLLAHDLLDADVPRAVVDRGRADPAVLRASDIFRRYFYQLATIGPGLLQRWSIPLSMIPQRPARIRYLLGRAFLPSPKDFALVSLPRMLFPLYYALRPIRLVLQNTPLGGPPLSSAAGGEAVHAEPSHRAPLPLARH